MKRGIMISAQIAFEASQKANRENWLKQAGINLGDKIMAAAQTGAREIHVSFKDLIIGSENVFEAGEMLCYLGKMLDKADYDHVITPDGTLIISW